MVRVLGDGRLRVLAGGRVVLLLHRLHGLAIEGEGRVITERLAGGGAEAHDMGRQRDNQHPGEDALAHRPCSRGTMAMARRVTPAPRAWSQDATTRP